MSNLVYDLCLKERYQDLSKLTIEDETEYGTPNPDRPDAARILFAAKMDELQALTYAVDLVNDTPLATTSWTFANLGLGAYRFFYVNVPLYAGGDTYKKEIVNGNGVVTQWANIIYHPTDETYYKAIGTSFSGIEPGVTSGWETSWEVFELDSFKTQYDNTNLEVFIDDDLSTGEYELCVLDEIEDRSTKELCGLCPNSPEFFKVIKMQFLLDAAESYNWQEKTPQADVIINQAHKKYCCA